MSDMTDLLLLRLLYPLDSLDLLPSDQPSCVLPAQLRLALLELTLHLQRPQERRDQSLERRETWIGRY